MITISKKAVIRATAIKAFKDGVAAVTAQGDDAKNVLDTMLSFKYPAIKKVCSSHEEISYFETCYVFRSQKQADEFAVWNEKYWEEAERAKTN